jgi:hypothetical protein
VKPSGMGARFIQREMFRSDTSKPSMSSSPWMREHPRWGFPPSGDQIPNFLRQPFSSDLVFHLRNQAPVESKSGTMPADHSFMSDHKERLFPVGPEPVGQNPEELVHRAESCSRMSAF